MFLHINSVEKLLFNVVHCTLSS